MSSVGSGHHNSPVAEMFSKLNMLVKQSRIVVVGFQIDAKAMVDVARQECTTYRENFGQPIPLSAYRGCAVGKAKQNATGEIEKLKMTELSAEDLVKEAARIITTVHDEVKDKYFELDLSWVGKCSAGTHQLIPKTLYTEASLFAKRALEEADDMDTVE